MITTFILSIVSLGILSLMIYSKKKENITGKKTVRVGTDTTDRALKTVYYLLCDKVDVLHPNRLKNTLRRVVIRIERGSMTVFHRFSHKFSVVGDVVTGRDIPKNRGSVSFFLKNIEDSKKQTSL